MSPELAAQWAAYYAQLQQYYPPPPAGSCLCSLRAVVSLCVIRALCLCFDLKLTSVFIVDVVCRVGFPGYPPVPGAPAESSAAPAAPASAAPAPPG